MLLVVAGDHGFLRDQKIHDLSREFKLPIQRLAIDNLTADQFRLELSKQDLFAEKRLIVIKNLSKNADLRQVGLDLFEQLQADQDLVLIDEEEEIDMRTKFAKTVNQAGVLSQFKLPKDYDEVAAKDFIITQAEKLKLELSSKQAGLIWQRVGADPWQQVAAVKKLACLGQAVTDQQIETYIDQKPEAVAFKIFDHLWSGDLLILERDLTALRQSGEVAPRFLGLITSQAVNLAAVKAANSLSQAQAELGLHPFAVKQLWQRAQQVNWRQVKLLINSLTAIDQQTKSLKAEPWELINTGLWQLVLDLKK